MKQLTPTDRALTAALIAGLWSGYVWLLYSAPRGFVSDFDQTWHAARFLVAGQDPYALIGPGRAFDFAWPYFYPLTAPVSVLPLAWLPLDLARAAFVALSVGALAYTVSGRGLYLLPLFVSDSMRLTAQFAQWSPLFMAALMVPAFGWFLGAKPNIAAAFAVGFPDWQRLRLALALAVAPLIASLIFQPSWPLTWWRTVAGAEHFDSLILLPGGAVLLLAALRWRWWEARLLLALAIIPQTPSALTALPLFLIPRTWKGAALLALLSYLPGRIAARTDASFVSLGRLTLWCLFVPALVVVLLRPAAPPVAAEARAA